MIERINEAIAKGWRFREAGPPGVWVLIDPESKDKDYGFTMRGSTVMQLMVPIDEIGEWLTAREPLEPDDKLRKEKKAQVQAWFHKEWDSYVRECDDNEDYAADIIIDDAASDFSMEEKTELLKTWLKEVRNSRS